MKHLLTFDEFLNESKISSKDLKELEKETDKVYDILLDHFKGDNKKFEVSYITLLERRPMKRVEIMLYDSNKSIYSGVLNLLKSKSYIVNMDSSSNLADADKFSTVEINIDLK